MFLFAGPILDYDRHDIEWQKKFVPDAFAGERWEVPRLLEATWAPSDFCFDRKSIVRVPGWSPGRAVLLGDPAFGGRMGMGTSRPSSGPTCWPAS
ncbi:MAG TPA: hypothetical protein VJT49_00645 [Amycolatopsis sp.]|uniref:hypothetical protein n=1 Tax=Amycolatopsis sp. TaxID=37632 RepID=UPI002B46F667|nr:hypothetical protein [Amycolatopsis sp.]HKS43623.1 hypothetical protein [Amycolatopsis sp.]